MRCLSSFFYEFTDLRIHPTTPPTPPPPLLRAPPPATPAALVPPLIVNVPPSSSVRAAAATVAREDVDAAGEKGKTGHDRALLSGGGKEEGEVSLASRPVFPACVPRLGVSDMVLQYRAGHSMSAFLVAWSLVRLALRVAEASTEH